MATVKWDNSISAVSLLTTELNSLAGSGAAITASAYNTATEQPTHGDFELVCAFGTGPTAGTVVSLYVIRSVDGTNFEDGATSGPVLPASGFAGVFVLRNTTSTQRMVLPKVELPPEDFHVLLVSAAGQTMAASANTLKLKPYRRVIA